MGILKRKVIDQVRSHKSQLELGLKSDPILAPDSAQKKVASGRCDPLKSLNSRKKMQHTEGCCTFEFNRFLVVRCREWIFHRRLSGWCGEWIGTFGWSCWCRSCRIRWGWGYWIIAKWIAGVRRGWLHWIHSRLS
jgi:hypothetical protein